MPDWKQMFVLVASNDYPDRALKMLSNIFTVRQAKTSGFENKDAAANKKEVSELIPGVSGIIWSTKHPLTKELLDLAGPQLKIVATPSAGYDHIDVSELKARGIPLCNTPVVLDGAVAEIAVGLMISTARRFTENLAQVRSGVWEIGMQKVLGTDIQASTVGIIGLGGIGGAIVKRLQGFSVAKFLYTGHNEKPEAAKLGASFVDLDTLLAQSDFVVLSCPLTSETKNIINENNLKKMKKNAVVINVGRGGLIDQEALYSALKNKQIFAAGLDVTTPEPLPKDHPLLTLPNVFVLPHVGSATVNTRNEMAELASNNAVLGMQDQPVLTPVY